MESVREMFDEMSLNVTAFLEVRRHPGGALSLQRALATHG